MSVKPKFTGGDDMPVEGALVAQTGAGRVEGQECTAGGDSAASAGETTDAEYRARHGLTAYGWREVDGRIEVFERGTLRPVIYSPFEWAAAKIADELNAVAAERDRLRVENAALKAELEDTIAERDLFRVERDNLANDCEALWQKLEAE